MKSLARCLFLAALGTLAAGGAVAQTLYKLIDKNGKVTYSESPPKDFDGKVIRMDIDPNANTATLPKPAASSSPESRPASVSGRGDKVQSARERVEAAKKALQEARDNPKEGDVQRMGKVGGGTRPVESEEYQKRLAGLEEDVRRAEEELRVAEGR